MSVTIETLSLFPLLDRKLIEVLRSLTPDEWEASTLAKQWRVKDIAAHLLDGNIRTISMSRDRYFGETAGAINSYRDLVNYLNRLNADWVVAMRRVSPTVIIDLLETTGPVYHDCLAALDPLAPAVFPVDWAGESESQNWFHIAREYTEKWHHQQQIREAVNKQGIMEEPFYSPLIKTFMRALPHTYRNVPAPEGTTIQFNVRNNEWYLSKREKGWTFVDPLQELAARTTIPADVAWKLFTKGIGKEEASAGIRFDGNRSLGEPILSMISVMA